jgi:hypothetical protein
MFYEWFWKVIFNLFFHCYIVVDSELCYSVKAEKLSATSWNKTF